MSKNEWLLVGLIRHFESVSCTMVAVRAGEMGVSDHPSMRVASSSPL